MTPSFVIPRAVFFNPPAPLPAPANPVFAGLPTDPTATADPVVVSAMRVRAAEREDLAVSRAAVGCPQQGIRRRFPPRHDGDGIMNAAIAMPGNTW